MTSTEAQPSAQRSTFDTGMRVVAAGVVCGLLAVIQSSGFGLFLLGGGAHPLSSTAIDMAILATGVASAIAAFTSSIPGTVSIAQTVPIAVLTTGVAHILTAAAGDVAVERITMVVFVAVASLAMGGAAWLLGTFRAGRFIRFVPYPVIAGFFGGCGWLIMLGGLGVAAGHRLRLDSLDLLADPSVQYRLLATVGLVGLIALLVRRYALSQVLPGVAALALVTYAVVAGVAGYAPEVARADGWLVNRAGEGSLWPPIVLTDMARVDWAALASAAVYLPVVVVLSIITVLMNANAIELAAQRDIDLDHELRSVGLQNLVGGAGGGLPGFHSVPLTLLAIRLRATSAAVGLIVAAICAVTLAFGDVFLSHIPTPLLGGLVMWVGLSLVIDWLIRSAFRLPAREYLVVILIFLVIITFGLVWGLVVGLIAAAVLFVVEYGQVEIVRDVLTGKDYQSARGSSEQRRRELQTVGDAILIVRLQGFLFFGTADRMRRRIHQQIERPGGHSVLYLVLDFHRVTGLDSSTVISFVRLAQASLRDGYFLVCCGMSEIVRSAMTRAGFGPDSDPPVRFVEDLDRGLEWCENDLLATLLPGAAGGAPVPVIDLLETVFGDRAVARRLLPWLERVEVESGVQLIEQGKPSNDVFFIESGQAAVILLAGQANLRLATMSGGSIVGEIAFYLGVKRSASIVAESPLVAWRLSAENLARLEAEMPDVLIRFHRGMAAILADRLTGANRLVRLLAD